LASLMHAWQFAWSHRHLPEAGARLFAPLRCAAHKRTLSKIR
jgi:hypothetical protein